jgi:hypothetical protein
MDLGGHVTPHHELITLDFYDWRRERETFNQHYGEHPGWGRDGGVFRGRQRSDGWQFGIDQFSHGPRAGSWNEKWADVVRSEFERYF